MKTCARADTATVQQVIEVQDPGDHGFPHDEVASHASQSSVGADVTVGIWEATDIEACAAAGCVPWCMDSVITAAPAAFAPRIAHSVPFPSSVSCRRNALESAARKRRERERGRIGNPGRTGLAFSLTPRTGRTQWGDRTMQCREMPSPTPPSIALDDGCDTPVPRPASPGSCSCRT